MKETLWVNTYDIMGWNLWENDFRSEMGGEKTSRSLYSQEWLEESWWNKVPGLQWVEWGLVLYRCFAFWLGRIGQDGHSTMGGNGSLGG